MQQARDLYEVYTVELVEKKGETIPKTFRFRRNGATQLWKTRPTEWRMPVKYGLRGYHSFTQNDADDLYMTPDEALLVGQEMVVRLTIEESERGIERDFIAALQDQTTWELGDDGTLDTVLICIARGHHESCTDREGAISVLGGGCDACEYLD